MIISPFAEINALHCNAANPLWYGGGKAKPLLQIVERHSAGALIEE